MKKLLVIFILIFGVLGGFLLFKQFAILGHNTNFQTDLNKNREIADSDLQVFNISAKMCNFIPNKIKVKTGDRVKIYIRSFDAMYGFSIPEYSVDVTIDAEQEGTVDFVADKAGEFQFFSSVFCTAPSAKPKEVVGTMTVE
jgi:cytochrome c oxidase subunit 2